MQAGLKNCNYYLYRAFLILKQHFSLRSYEVGMYTYMKFEAVITTDWATQNGSLYLIFL